MSSLSSPSPSPVPARVMEVFESSDVPSTAAPSALPPRASASSLRSDDVVQLDLNPSLAFATFAGALFTSSPPSSLPSPPPPSIRFESLGNPTDGEKAKAKSQKFESPIDKFNRIKGEILDFQRDLESLRAAIVPSGVSADSADTAKIAEIIAAELSALSAKMTEILTEGKFKILLAEDADAVESISKGIHSEGIIQSAPSPSPSTNPSPPSLSPQSPNAPPSLSFLSSLDRRLAALEKSVGLPVGLGVSVSPKVPPPSSSDSKEKSSAKATAASPSGQSAISQNSQNLQSAWASLGSSFPDLYSGILSLHRKLLLLEPSKIEGINRAVKAITAEIEGVESQKNVNSMGEGNLGISIQNQQKINEIYDALPRWDALCLTVPSVVNRLNSLKALHEAAASLAEREKFQHSQLTEISKIVLEDRETLKEMQTNLTENSQQIDRNFKALEEKIKSLQDKIQQNK